MFILDFIQVSQPVSKQDFLQHITELVHIKLEKGDTYNTIFDKLRESFKDEPEERKQAAEEWITFNQEEHKENLSVFDTVVTEEENEFAVFNLRQKQ